MYNNWYGFEEYKMRRWVTRIGRILLVRATDNGWTTEIISNQAECCMMLEIYSDGIPVTSILYDGEKWTYCKTFGSEVMYSSAKYYRYGGLNLALSLTTADKILIDTKVKQYLESSDV